MSAAPAPRAIAIIWAPARRRATRTTTIFSLYALDLAPDALQPGLTRDQFLDAVKGHVLDNGSLVGRAPSRLRSP